jgi:glutamine amidotransferase
MIAIVDTGGANLSSIVNALTRLESHAEITIDVGKIKNASHVIFPGVGSAADSMAKLEKKELVPVLRELKQPVLGICLGMQLLFSYSEEGKTDCLGILPGRVTKILNAPPRPVPHMGWNTVVTQSNPGPLFATLPEESYFYFIHSYAAPSGDWVTATCEYGTVIPAAVQKDNFFGVQFHPEKSARAGAQLLKNFLAL